MAPGGRLAFGFSKGAMSNKDLDELAVLIKRHRDALLTSWREQVCLLPSARSLDTPTLNDHVPTLIDELVDALRSHTDTKVLQSLAVGSPPAHGLQRVKDGFDIGEVVSEYSVLRSCVHDLIDANGLGLDGRSYKILNSVFDGAIGLAVESFAKQRALEIQNRREEYLAFVAHDLRTPLNAISLAGRILERTYPGLDSSADSARMFKALRRNVEHLEKLVSKVLEENENLETEVGFKLVLRDLDLWPLVEALIHDLHPVAGTDSTRLINRVPEDTVIHADAGSLKRALQNLIANAIRFTPRGEIVIEARERAPDGGVECSVTDNGAGIPEGQLDRIFEKGATDSANEGGMGLGLPIVKAIVDAHHGELTVESVSGTGSTFRFWLPGALKAA